MMRVSARKGFPLPDLADTATTTASTGRGTTTSGVVRDTPNTFGTIADYATDYDLDEQITGRWEFESAFITDKGSGQLFTNNTGGARIAGDVVMVDPAVDQSIILPSAAAIARAKVGVVAEAIAGGAVGRVAFEGFIRVKVAGGVGRGSYLQTQSGSVIAAGVSYAQQGTFGLCVTNADGVPSCLVRLNSPGWEGGAVANPVILAGSLTFAVDNSVDIGAAGATRPRNVYVGTGVIASQLTGTLQTAAQPNITSVGILAATHLTSPVVDSGGLTVTLGGITATGNSTITGTLGGITTLTATTLAGTLSTAAQPNITSVGILAATHLTSPVVDSGGLTVTLGGITVTGNSTITGTLSSITTLTATTLAGTLSTAAQGSVTSVGTLTSITTSGALTFTAAASKIIPGATSISHRNNADSADNLIITDAGAATIRAGLTVTAGGLTVTAGGLTVTAGNVGIGAAPVGQIAFYVGGGTIAAASAASYAIAVSNVTVQASANSDSLYGAYIQPTYSANSKTGLVAYGIRSNVVAAAGFATAYGLYVDAPTLATANIGIYNAGTTQLAGNVGVGVAPTTQNGITFQATLSGAVNQWGIYSNPTGNSSATGEVTGVYSAPQTAATSFTVSAAIAFHAGNPIKGAGSTITGAYGLYVDSMTVGGSYNYGIYINTPSGGATANIAIYVAGGGITVAGGGLTISDSGPLSIGSTPATSGTIRIPNGGSIAQRNAGNSADLKIYFDGSGAITFEGANTANGGSGGNLIGNTGAGGASNPPGSLQVVRWLSTNYSGTVYKIPMFN